MKLRLRQLLISLVLLPLILVAVGFNAPHKANAVTGADWRPGRIIDDAIFFNKDAMSVGQIQTFLNSKVPVCAKNHSAYSATYPGPYTCLKDYQENTTTSESNVGRYNPDGSPYQVPGGKSAAQIIWDAAQAYSINPQTLLVMLQKEQSLVTDDWPLIIQYQKAMGQSCPDTAPCDPAFAGFYRQVSGAAWQIRHYINNPQYFNYRSGVTRFVLYNPNAGCGGTNVFIENNATAALYNYTPYQPNAGALNNLYGTATCGAYGNRNFWRLFNDWFGSTLAPNFSAQYYSQSALPTIKQGQSATIAFQYKNVGNIAWLDETTAGSNWTTVPPVRLATSVPLNRASAFALGWPTSNRPIGIFNKVYEADGTTLAANQHVVAPGQIAKFEFTITAPDSLYPGVYREWFQPVLEGSTLWNMNGAAWTDIIVLESRPQATYVGQSFASTNVVQGEQASTYFKYKNTGSMPWYDSNTSAGFYAPIHLATANPINRASVFGNSWFGIKNRPSLLFSSVYEPDGTTLAANQHVVAPGQIAKFDFGFSVPANLAPGVYREWFQLAQDGSAKWDVAGSMAWLEIVVSQSVVSSAFYSQSAFPVIRAGQSSNASLAYKNTGNSNWYDSNTSAGFYAPIHLATANPINRASVFGNSWFGIKNRPSLLFSSVYEPDGTTLAANQHVVAPGQIAKFDFGFSVPANLAPGVYREWFQLAQDGSAKWDVAGSMAWLEVTVIP